MPTPEEFRCPEYVIVDPSRKINCWGYVGHEWPFHQGMLRVRRKDGSYYAVSVTWLEQDQTTDEARAERLRLAD